MNIWFILATLCAIGVPIFSIIGTQQQSDTDSKHLKEQFSELSEQITDLNDSSDLKNSNLVEINEEYKKLATDYHKSRHQKAMKILADKSGNTVSQLEKTEEFKKRFKELHQTTLKIVAAYNEQSGTTKIDVIRSEVPDNLFSDNADRGVYIVLNADTERWAVRPFIHDDELLFEFGRLEANIKDYIELADKYDPFEVHASIFSIYGNFVLVNRDNRYAQEFNYLSENLRKIQPISEINILAEDVVLKIVELMLLPSINE